MKGLRKGSRPQLGLDAGLTGGMRSPSRSHGGAEGKRRVKGPRKGGDGLRKGEKGWGSGFARETA